MVVGLLSVLILIHLPATIRVHATRLATNLIHYDSSLSPYFNPSDTLHHVAKRSIERSISRFAYLTSKLSIMQSYGEVFEMDLVPSKIIPQFFVNISLGEPPVPQLVIMDTGSSLFWVKCLPCTQCSNGIHVFDPTKSSTYSMMTCDNSVECGSYSCSHLKVCSYRIRYVQGPSSTGYISTERITFEDQEAVDGIQFGCGHENGRLADSRFNGVLGLGISKNDKTIARQLGNKFSYCTGNPKDPNYSYNRLYFGDGIEFDGTSTPLRAINGHYYVSLEGISVGANRLSIDPIIFKKEPRVNNGVIIDSGSGLSFLAKGAYDVLSSRVEELLDYEFMRYDDPSLPLCYEGRMDEDLESFPIVTFHFENGADLVLDSKSSFVQPGSNFFCSSFVPSDINKGNHENLTVIGMLAQQNYNIGFDLDSMHLYIQNIDCQFVD